VAFVPGTMSPSPDAGGASPEEEKNDVGRAIRNTPVNDMTVAIFSIRVNGSFISTEHTQHTYRKSVRRFRHHLGFHLLGQVREM
jgi:hypothetical protein